jgi:hypothetical protein
LFFFRYSDDDDDDDDEEYDNNRNAKKMKMSDCIQCCSRAPDQGASTSGNKTLVGSQSKNLELTSSKDDLYKIINYGASTSKACGSSKSNIVQFKTNRKSDCVSNCLDCTTGCEGKLRARHFYRMVNIVSIFFWFYFE